MLQMICSCGEMLANKQVLYEEEMRNTCDAQGVDYNMISNGSADQNEKFRKIRQDIVNKLGRRWCCKTNIMNYVSKVHLMKG